MQLFLVIGLVILCLILQETLSNTSKPGNEIEPLKKKKKDEHIIVVDYNEYTGEYDLEVYDYYRIYSHPEIDLLCFYTYHRCKKKKKKHRLSHGGKVRVPKKQVMCLLNSEGSQCVGQKLTLSKRIGKYAYVSYPLEYAKIIEWLIYLSMLRASPLLDGSCLRSKDLISCSSLSVDYF